MWSSTRWGNPAVFLRRVGENQDVVEIYGDDDFGDQVLEYGQTIGEAKVHD
jgi:hypothetical protein